MSETLTTARLRLRPWKAEDAEELYVLASDPEVGPLAGWAPHPNADYSRQIIANFFMSETMWAIEELSTGRLVGSIGTLPNTVSNLPIDDDEEEAGYWVARDKWGQGYCTEALGAVVAQRFGSGGCRALWATVFPDNAASRRVLEKCGFADTERVVVSPRIEVGGDRKLNVLRLAKK